MKAKVFQLMMLLLILVSYPSTVPAQTQDGQRKSATQDGTSVTGVVVDADGETLPGVSVRIPGRNIGVVTNENGFFSIKARPGETIVISYVGKKPVEVKAKPGTQLRIVLEDGGDALNEVVVTGIYSRNKESFTGSSKNFRSG